MENYKKLFLFQQEDIDRRTEIYKDENFDYDEALIKEETEYFEDSSQYCDNVS